MAKGVKSPVAVGSRYVHLSNSSKFKLMGSLDVTGDSFLNAMQRHHDARGGDAVLLHCCVLFKGENGQRGGCTALLPAVLSLLVAPTKKGSHQNLAGSRVLT